MESVTLRNWLSGLALIALAACASGYRASPQQHLHAECLKRYESDARIHATGTISLACQRWAAGVVQRASLLSNGRVSR